MDEQEQALYTVAEAAAAWGITKQAVYQRLNKLNKQGFIVEQGKKRYITREGIESYNQVEQPKPTNVEQETNQNQPTLNKLNKEVESLKEELIQAKAALLEEQGRSASLQATVEAQQSHIDSLKTALDREQALHMASLQKRLPAPRRSFLEWLRGPKESKAT